MEDRHLRKSHNKTCLLYHVVLTIKFRREVLTDGVVKTFTHLCLEIQHRYDINFIEIGTDDDHVHMLVQATPTASPSELVQTIKSITAKHLFKLHPEVKRMLWGGQFWTRGYYVNTVGQHATAETIRKYVAKQGKRYDQIYQGQLSLFDSAA